MGESFRDQEAALTQSALKRNQSNENETSRISLQSWDHPRKGAAAAGNGRSKGDRKLEPYGARASSAEAITANARPTIFSSPGTTPAISSEITAVTSGPPALVSGATTIALPCRKA